MKRAKSIYHCQGWLTTVFTVFVSVLSFLTSSGQSNITYTVDPDFSTGQTLRSKTSVFDIYPLEDGGYFLGGGFITLFTNPDSPFDQGLAMITSSGSVHPDWGGGETVFCRGLHEHDGGFIYATGEFLAKETLNGESWYWVFGENWGDYYLFGEWGSGWDNPYNVRWTQDIFILEDQSVLIGGAIATDTLQPGLFRHLMRLLPDGSHDDTFPIIEAIPQGLNTHISKIERASDGSWYVSGRFQGINGHISPHIAHLTPDFEVDTEFVSPFYYESVCCGLHTEMKLLDSQDRIWFSGMRVRLANDPDEYLHLVRLLPDGSVDPDFVIGKLESQYPFGWYVPPAIVEGVLVPELEDAYYLHGVFTHYNDTAQSSVTAIDDNGNILENYFQGQGATMNAYDPDDPEDIDGPAVYAGEILEDGSILFGGSFSNFMGVERYSMVKLIPGTLSSGDLPKPDSAIKVYPNPASDYTSVEYRIDRAFREANIEIHDLLGRTVYTMELQEDLNIITLPLSNLSGAYIVSITVDDELYHSTKLLIR